MLPLRRLPTATWGVQPEFNTLPTKSQSAAFVDKSSPPQRPPHHHQDDLYLYPQFPGVARPLQTGEKLFLWLVAGSGAPVEVAEDVIFLGGQM